MTHAEKTVTDPALVYGTTLNYTCQIGYRQTHGDLKQMCQADGSWSGQNLTCQGQYCHTIYFQTMF